MANQEKGLRIPVVPCGNMRTSQVTAYHPMHGLEIYSIVPKGNAMNQYAAEKLCL